MELDILYKRTKTGDINFWKIEIVPGENSATLVKTSGRLKTDSPQVYREVITEGKNVGKANATTPLQQAESQASSDWRKKLDEGYKTIAMLGIRPVDVKLGGGILYHYPGYNSPTHGAVLEDALQQTLPQFNTDAQGNVLPMKAPTKPWKPGQRLAFPQLLQPKFDGVRATLVIRDDQGDMEFLSSSGKIYGTLRHLKEEIQRAIAAKKLIIEKFPLILDGEIYCHGMLLEEINEAVKRYRAETLQLEYWLFDLPKHLGLQSQRTNEIGEIARQIDSAIVRFADTVSVETDEQIIEHHNVWVQYGYEGAMLKHPNGLYQQGQRSSFWRKVKEFDDTEFEILRHTLGQRGVEDLMFICASPGGEFEVKMSGSLARKEKLYQRAAAGELTGKYLTVKHFGYTKYDKPNLPTGKALRED